ncbi:Transcription elongation factor spt6, partial [Nowakowskiella sp. JEL0078]
LEIHQPEDPIENPLIAAENFVCPEFPNPESVLRAARHMAAQEITADVNFRGFIRRVYESDVALTTYPTEKGKTEIDSTHSYYPFKYLKDKLIVDYSDAQQPLERDEKEQQEANALAGQYLLIHEAEERKLLNVIARIEVQDRLMGDVHRHITNDFQSDLATCWNEERKIIADEAMHKFLLPTMEKWIKDSLHNNATKWVAEKCQLAMERKIAMAPYRPYKNENDYSVMSLSWGDGDRLTSTFAVVLDSNGQMEDRAKFDFLSDFKPENRESGFRKLAEFIFDHNPAVIVVGGTTIITKTKLFEEVKKIAGDRTNVIMVDDDTARSFMKSRRALKEFPDTSYPDLLRYCVGLGRKVLEPTMEYAGMFNKDDEFKTLRLHPLQHLLPEDTLRKSIERAFINVVNMCGVDINMAVKYPHHSHTLQFVSGFGPRKAQALIKEITARGGKLQARSKLVANSNGYDDDLEPQFKVGPSILMNCVSFLRICKRHFDEEDDLEVLDDTRIHLEDYRLAQQMAVDALEVDKSMLDDSEMSQYVADLMTQHVERLNLLLLDDFATELERTENLLKRVTLVDIKTELMDPYRELRRRFEPAGSEEIFTMLTGETTETLRTGVIVTTSVSRVWEKNVKVRLSCGLEGNVLLADLSDESYGYVAADYVSEGDVLRCVVLNLDRTTMQVWLSAKQSDVENALRNLVVKDRMFDDIAEAADIQKRQDELREKQIKQIRVIDHPQFKQFDYRQSVEYLDSLPPGEFVIRPSSRSPNIIAITWKVADNLYHNIDIVEEAKADAVSVGKRLLIGQTEFSELDEIIVNYLGQMFTNVNEVVKHPKYRNKTKRELANEITTQVNTTKRTAYGFVLNRENPSCFDFMFYHPGSRVREEPVIVKVRGLGFRQKVFRNVDDLINYWKADEMKKMKSERSRGSGSGGGSARSQTQRPGQSNMQDPRYRQQSSSSTSSFQRSMQHA